MPLPSTAASASTSGPTRRVVLSVVLLLLVAGWAYGPIWFGDWVYDDLASVRDNLSLRRLADAWFPPDGPLSGRPLANFTFALNWAWSGEAPFSYRLVNFLLHGLNAALVTGWASAMLAPSREERFSLWTWSGFAVGALWFVHPLHTASVGYVAQRTELLAAFFLLSAGAVFLVGKPSHVGWAVIGTCALAGAACKETVAVLPLVLAVVARVTWAPTWRAVWRQVGPALVVLALGLWAWQAWLRSGAHTVGQGVGDGVTRLDYALAQSRILWDYVRLCVWPHPLVFSRGPALLHEPVLWVFPLATGLVVVATLWTLARWPRQALAPALFGLSLAVSSSVVPLRFQPMAENRLYLGSAVVLAVVVWLLGRFPAHTRFSLVFVGVAFGSVMTHERFEVQASSLALWQDTVAKAPTNAVAHHNLGELWRVAQRPEQAQACFERARELDPTFALAWARLAQISYAAGRKDQGRVEFERALTLRPDEGQVRALAVVTWLEQGEIEQAAKHLSPWWEQRYVPAVAFAAAAWVALEKKNLPEARRQWELAQALDPEDSVVRRVGRRLQSAGPGP